MASPHRLTGFTRFAKAASRATGHPATFLVALLVVVVWAVSGPLFHFSDTWQLVINTGTTVITFLMVFLIQNTQNRDSEVVHLKLDELIRATREADNRFLDLEAMDDRELEAIHARYQRLADEACDQLRARRGVDDDPLDRRASQPLTEKHA